jgi:hypothetical protein
VHDPEIVFLDEPTGALDPQARRNLWDLPRAVSAEGRTVILTTHHMDEAETLCQRVAIMDHGSILRIGPPAELIRSAGQDVRIAAESGQLSLGDARALVAAADPDGRADDDGVTLSIIIIITTTTQPALVLTALARTQQAASSIANLIILPMAFLGGAFIPLDFAPSWMRQVSYLMPLRYLVTGTQDVMARAAWARRPRCPPWASCSASPRCSRWSRPACSAGTKSDPPAGGRRVRGPPARARVSSAVLITPSGRDSAQPARGAEGATSPEPLRHPGPDGSGISGVHAASGVPRPPAAYGHRSGGDRGGGPGRHGRAWRLPLEAP